MRFDFNPYYSPEECGLELFYDIDTAGSYEFDMFVIWKKLDDNTLWWDYDSGCSCPTPFEDHKLVPITSDTMFSFKEALKNHRDITDMDIRTITDKVEDFLGDEGCSEMSINDFIKQLQSLKPSLRKLPVIMVAPNGIEFEPKAKRLLEKNQTFVDEATKMIITYD